MNERPDSTRSVAESLAERVARPVVYQLPDMDRVRVISNLKYSEMDNPYLLMDVYLPLDLKPHERRPVVVFVHGGVGPEYKPNDWGMFQSWGRLVAAAGIVAVMFTHRFSPPPQFRCLVAFYALLDVQQYAPPGDAAALRYLKAFSAVASLPQDASTLMPMLVVRAGRDDIPTLNDALDRFVARALAANAPITVVNHPTGGHGFDSFDNKGDEERSKQIVRSSIGFMRTHLGLA
jgi:acetyl esterase/lipase